MFQYSRTMNMHRIVGVLNVTPDSYFDGGKYAQVDAAVARTGELLSQGADIIDIGGESTGPGSHDVSVDEELSRVVPIIQAILHRYPEALLAVDTYKAEVAKQAIAEGVCMVNDVTAGRGDSDIFAVIAAADVEYVLMFSKDETARTTVADTEYDDVIATIRQFLEERIALATKAGIQRNKLIIDPGMGHFVSSKSEYSFEIIRRLSELTTIAPVYLSPSRKSFLAGDENLPPADRLPGTIAASSIAVLHGASYIRTHDVQEVRRACEVSQRLRQ